VVGLSKILAPGNDDVGIINSQQDEILSKGLVPDNRVDIGGDQSFCRKKDNRPPTLTNFLQQVSAALVAAWRLSAVNETPVSPKSDISEAWNYQSQEIEAFAPARLLTCAFPSSMSGVTTRATGLDGG